MKKITLAAPVIAALLAEGIHYEPDARPPSEHVEQHHERDPIPRGRVTEWLTSTSTAAPATSTAEPSTAFRNLK